MRTAFNKEIARSITRSWSRFVAIFAIVALGAGFYAGLRMCAPDMRLTVDEYLDDTRFMDVHIISTLGFSDADVEAVKSVRGVSAVMPTHITDVTATVADRRATVRVHALDIEAAAASSTSSDGSATSGAAAYLNRPILVAGRWPERSGECAIDHNKVYANTAQIGAPVTLTAGVTPLEDTFARTDFTIVGIVDSSYYLAFNRGTTSLNDGNVDRVMYVPEMDFADPDTYTDLFATVRGAAGPSTFTSAYDDIVQPVAAALEDLAPARESARLPEVKVPAWYVLGRGTNVGYASLSSDADRVAAISIVFPLIFFLVAALVALTTMTRMVDEERTLIGTYKALGYGRGRIAAKYLVYAGVAGVLGSVAGILVGSQVLPRTVWRAYTTMYTAPAILTPIDVPLALIAGVSAVGVTLVATLAAVDASLRDTPATLMLPRAPKPGKRIFLERVRPVWSRLTFSRKVTARNLFRYKKRLLMTIIGIAGCTALLLTGFGLRNSISDVLDRQYGVVYLYDTTVGFDEGTLGADPSADAAGSTETSASLRALLDDPASFSRYAVLRTESVTISNADDRAAETSASAGEPVSGTGFGGSSEKGPGAGSVNGYLSCPSDPAGIGGFISLQERVSGTAIPLDDAGAVITEKAARTLGLDVGDTVRVERIGTAGTSAEESEVTFTITGITEQYVSHYVYVSPALYEDAFGEAPPYNEVIATAAVTDEAARDELSQALLARNGVTTVQFTEDITSSFDDMLKSLDAVVFVLIFSAAMLAFIVLYNLTNINVIERRREIATIKVLGFYDAEVNAYIYRETAVLAVLGCALGLLLGIGLEAFVVTTAEVDIVMFGRTIHPMSYVYAAALTLLFALIVNIAMAPRLRSIDMVESLKSIE